MNRRALLTRIGGLVGVAAAGFPRTAAAASAAPAPLPAENPGREIGNISHGAVGAPGTRYLRRLDHKLRDGILNVTDWGPAVGRDNPDVDTRALQDLLDLGRVVRIPEGVTLRLTGGTRLPSHSGIIGPGTIHHLASKASYCVSIGDSEVTSPYENIVIRGVNFFSDIDKNYVFFISMRHGGDLDRVNILENAVVYRPPTFSGHGDRWFCELSPGGAIPNVRRTRIAVNRNIIDGRMELTAGGGTARYDKFNVCDNVGTDFRSTMIAMQGQHGVAWQRVRISRNLGTSTYFRANGIHVGLDGPYGDRSCDIEDVVIDGNCFRFAGPDPDLPQGQVANNGIIFNGGCDTTDVTANTRGEALAVPGRPSVMRRCYIRNNQIVVPDDGYALDVYAPPAEKGKTQQFPLTVEGNDFHGAVVVSNMADSDFVNNRITGPHGRFTVYKDNLSIRLSGGAYQQVTVRGGTAKPGGKLGPLDLWIKDSLILGVPGERFEELISIDGPQDIKLRIDDGTVEKSSRGAAAHMLHAKATASGAVTVLARGIKTRPGQKWTRYKNSGSGTLVIDDDAWSVAAAARHGAAALTARRGRVTTETLRTPPGGEAELVLHDPLAMPGDAVLASVANGTNSAGTPFVTSTQVAAGRITIGLGNFHRAQSFNGTLVVTFELRGG